MVDPVKISDAYTHRLMAPVQIAQDIVPVNCSEDEFQNVLSEICSVLHIQESNGRLYRPNRPVPRDMTKHGREYDDQIIRLANQGLTNRQIADASGLTYSSTVAARKRLSDEGRCKPGVRGMKRAIIQFDLKGHEIARYPSILEAARATGVARMPIQRSAAHKQKTGCGYLWKYATP